MAKLLKEIVSVTLRYSRRNLRRPLQDPAHALIFVFQVIVGHASLAEELRTGNSLAEELRPGHPFAEKFRAYII